MLDVIRRQPKIFWSTLPRLSRRADELVLTFACVSIPALAVPARDIRPAASQPTVGEMAPTRPYPFSHHSTKTW